MAKKIKKTVKKATPKPVRKVVKKVSKETTPLTILSGGANKTLKAVSKKTGIPTSTILSGGLDKVSGKITDENVRTLKKWGIKGRTIDRGVRTLAPEKVMGNMERAGNHMDDMAGNINQGKPKKAYQDSYKANWEFTQGHPGVENTKILVQDKWGVPVRENIVKVSSTAGSIGGAMGGPIVGAIAGGAAGWGGTSQFGTKDDHRLAGTAAGVGAATGVVSGYLSKVGKGGEASGSGGEVQSGLWSGGDAASLAAAEKTAGVSTTVNTGNTSLWGSTGGATGEAAKSTAGESIKSALTKEVIGAGLSAGADAYMNRGNVERSQANESVFKEATKQGRWGLADRFNVMNIAFEPRPQRRSNIAPPPVTARGLLDDRRNI